MDKQIEEMTKETCGQQIYPYGKDRPICWLTKEDCTCRADNQCDHYEVCEQIYNAGYRKIHEGVVDYIENYKEGFKEGVVALKTQLEGILTQPVEMGYYKKPNKRGKVDKELLLRIVEEICKELVD